ncbi:hypothetical protein BJF83_10075 [Nocardiopsis sp. CNR-923]|uniref:hypothetical protein n=1 Tax=Nocardiopsis sp. CNR-923 TaxID=1904965 RepID=UPI0009699E07|nr:hypothetical protein [Nocardiopsis sp. CNR-923]OLT29726.1 hypothetical protein BJF83_10075 [Nocardiopsis sp. CNR-923]
MVHETHQGTRRRRSDGRRHARIGRARRGVEPTPQCESNGNKPPCWEYYSWYWTYERCHEVGKQQVSAHARYNDYTCDGGATVYLWLHRV